MRPNPAVQGFVIFIAIIAFAGLFGSLLWDTWEADEPFEPKGIHLYLTPIVGGALGLVLAIALGVDPEKLGAVGVRKIITIERLLLFAAVVYIVAALAGGFVWWKKDDLTPELVTTLVLTVAGYAAAAMTALGRKPG